MFLFSAPTLAMHCTFCTSSSCYLINTADDTLYYPSSIRHELGRPSVYVYTHRRLFQPDLFVFTHHPPFYSTDLLTMATPLQDSGIIIEPMTSTDDIAGGYDVLCATFGEQIQDGIWMAFNPGWNTPQGKEAGIQRMVKRWEGITTDRNGDPNTVFLKATVPTTADQDSQRKVVGFAAWVQLSTVDGFGDKPVEDISKSSNLDALYPGDKAEQEYLRDLHRSLHSQRDQVIKSKATLPLPAVYALDLCVVDPAYQGRGIAKELVKWGIAEAKRRGDLELVTEGSVMGRRVYEKLGFKPQQPDIVYDYDPKFEARARPSNLFMRTGGADGASA